MGVLGRKIGVRMANCAEDWARQPEVRRLLARQQAALELAGAARELAATGAEDEEVCQRLRARLPADDRLVAAATDHLAAIRTSYLDDRAYRLLTAAATPAPVRPIDPDVSTLFEAERQLGRSSLTDAFERLAALEPRLRAEARRTWESWERTTQAASEGRRPPKGRRRSTLIGPSAECGDRLLKTELAASVVSDYAIATQGGRRRDDDPKPFFERAPCFRQTTDTRPPVRD